MKYIGMQGLAEFFIEKNKCNIKITFAGNMGSDLKDVKDCAKEFFGMDIFKLNPSNIKEAGSPDYFYEIVMQFNKQDFTHIIGKNKCHNTELQQTG